MPWLRGRSGAGSQLVRKRFGAGSGLVRGWFGIGSRLIPCCVPAGQQQFRCSFARVFAAVSLLLCVVFTDGRALVCNWLETCSALAQGVCKFRSGSVQDWFTVGPLLVRCWLVVVFLLAHASSAAAARVLRSWFSIALRKLRSRPLRRRFAAGFRMAKGAGSGLVHGWLRVGSALLTIGWFAVGSLLLSCCVAAISLVFVIVCQLVLCRFALAARTVGCWFATVSKVVQDGLRTALVRGFF